MVPVRQSSPGVMSGCSLHRLLLLVLAINVTVLIVITHISYDAVVLKTAAQELGFASLLEKSKEKKRSMTPRDGIDAPTIAYAISVIKCGDHQNTPRGMLDAATILRHSVHQTSVRNRESGSKYDYQMYVIVHPQAQDCVGNLEDVGYKVLVRSPPVNVSDIKDPIVRKSIHKAECCGADEFIKLYAYSLVDHPLVVHVDLDFMMAKPMDKLFDAMLAQQGSEGENENPWDDVEVMYDDLRPNATYPKYIEAAITRDYPDIIPGRKSAFQAGFIVLRPNPSVIPKFVDTITNTEYVPGYSRENGWGGKGYGMLVGAMAMQGLVAYFYDIVQPDTTVELNLCRYNYMAMDILYRPHSKGWMEKKKSLRGKCRTGRETCEDCTQTPVEDIHNVHFTVCRKPWYCPSKAFNSRGSRNYNTEINPNLIHLEENLAGKNTYIDLNIASFDKCMAFHHKWHALRNDLEDKLYAITSDNKILSTRSGKWERQYFLGHCEEMGGYNFMNIYENKTTLSKLVDVWENAR